MQQLQKQDISVPTWTSMLESASRSMPGKRCVEVAERYLLCSVNAEQILEILENGFSESEAAKNEMHTAANYLYDNPEEMDRSQLRAPSRVASSESERLRDLRWLHCEGREGNQISDMYYCFVARVTCGASLQIQGLDRLRDAASSSIVATDRYDLATIPGTSPPFSYHTLVVNADGAGSGQFRQIVVFDGKLIYPEYLLGYYRVFD